MRCTLWIAVMAMLLMVTTTSWAADSGATIYTKKCAGCHGAQGEGKPAMKTPALKGTTKSIDELVAHITKGEPDSKPPHNKGIAGVKDDQAKAIAEYLKSLM